jgi:hypothetical protein
VTIASKFGGIFFVFFRVGLVEGSFFLNYDCGMGEAEFLGSRVAELRNFLYFYSSRFLRNSLSDNGLLNKGFCLFKELGK